MRPIVFLILALLGLEAPAAHWAFEPLKEPTIGSPSIDAFIARKLKRNGLTPAPEADSRTLIRRLHYTLMGLPPDPARVEQAPDYHALVDELLASPHYGEHWGRHWLDVARYSDTKGYVYGREERFWTHAWAYRDWVVQALNQDLPYDRFLLLQIAADQVEDREKGDEAAMGFLTLGRRFLGVKRDIIDDRIDVVTRGTMGLTVSCARCHDHKYDPIPTRDYYSLFSIFDSSAERTVTLGDPDIGDAAYRKKLRELRDAYDSLFAKLRKTAADRARQRLADYLFAQTELHKYPAAGFDQIFETTDIFPAFVHRWQEFLRGAKETNDPVFLHWRVYAAAKNLVQATRELALRQEADPRVAAAFKTPPTSTRDVAERYAKVLQHESFAQITNGPDSPFEIPDLPVVHCDIFFASGEITRLFKAQGEIDRWIVKSKVESPQALMLVDRPRPVRTRVYLRGNPRTLGHEAPRKFLDLLGGSPLTHGSGRLELATAIVDPGNPLTARVIVNRVWMHHFGRGLVETPSDFGLRAKEPSHPELLDWLASEFIRDGWSLKKLHRRILTSSAFRRSSAGNALAIQQDPENRLLWRMSPRRLSFEELRDSMIAASGDLDRRMGGKPTDMFKPPYPMRRTIYGLIDRQFFPATMRVFDVATPDLHVPQRPETSVPQQALFFLNDPMVLDRLKRVASSAEQDPKARVGELFQRLVQRQPSQREIAESLALVNGIAEPANMKTPSTSQDWQYGYGKLDETNRQVNGFTRLPHFAGEAWQGGPEWPDPKLGWVQLHASGGHPGNTREFAAIRRWTAPRSMRVRVESHIRHEARPGDGIRAFIVSPATDVFLAATLHQGSHKHQIDELTVAQGDTIDFVVDIDKVLNSDQYHRWSTITEISGGAVWNSESDFTPNAAQRLNGWEQLAQALLCSNEFLFVD